MPNVKAAHEASSGVTIPPSYPSNWTIFTSDQRAQVRLHSIVTIVGIDITLFGISVVDLELVGPLEKVRIRNRGSRDVNRARGPELARCEVGYFYRPRRSCQLPLNSPFSSAIGL